LKEANFKLKLEKCEFAKWEIKVLKHQVNVEETKPDSDKVEVILKQSRSTTIIRVRTFLEAAVFFKKYIQNFGKIITLLYYITLNKVSNYWISEMEEI